MTYHISPIYQWFKTQNFSSVYLQRNVRSTFQADIHSLNLTWLSPACVCSFFSSPRILSTYPIWNEFSESEKIILLSWIPRMKQHTYLYRLSSYQGRNANLDRFFAKNHRNRRKLLFFVNRHSVKLSKSVTIRLSFSMSHLNFLIFVSFVLNLYFIRILRNIFFQFLKHFFSIIIW